MDAEYPSGVTRPDIDYIKTKRQPRVDTTHVGSKKFEFQLELDILQTT